MSEPNDRWQEYRKRRNLAPFAFFGYVPIVFLFLFVTVHLFHTQIPGYIAAFSWVAFYAVAGIGFQSFKCPRCGKWFFAKW